MALFENILWFLAIGSLFHCMIGAKLKPARALRLNKEADDEQPPYRRTDSF